MRAIVGILAIVTLLFAIGWITFKSDGDKPSLTVETEKIQKDTAEAAEAGGKALRDTGDALEDAGEEAKKENKAEEEQNVQGEH